VPIATVVSDTSLPEIRVGARGGGASGGLAFRMEKQQQDNWCWAATTASIANFYHPGSGWSQCLLANQEFGQTTCCANGGTPQCNKGGYPDSALRRTGHLDRMASGAASYSEIAQQVGARRPLGVVIYWDGGGGHFVVAAGYGGARGGGPGGGKVRVEDPWYGPSQVDYSTLVKGYQGAGSWAFAAYTR
jgi:hypothetical protein